MLRTSLRSTPPTAFSSSSTRLPSTPCSPGRRRSSSRKRIEKGDLEAKERLINSNLRLVIKFARRYQGHGLPMGDLVQEAMLGLIRAAEKFDWRRGYKFSTYAVLWIKQSIQRGLDNTGRAVRIPAHVAQRERTVNRISAELAIELDREPTDEEVAERAKLPLDEVMATRDLTRVTSEPGPADRRRRRHHAGRAAGRGHRRPRGRGSGARAGERRRDGPRASCPSSRPRSSAAASAPAGVPPSRSATSRATWA